MNSELMNIILDMNNYEQIAEKIFEMFVKLKVET